MIELTAFTDGAEHPSARHPSALADPIAEQEIGKIDTDESDSPRHRFRIDSSG